MRYWDASALVPLIVDESATKRTRAWLEEDGAIVTWGWTRVEIIGAVERRAREGGLSRPQRREALDRIGAFAETWDEVTDLITVRSRAISLLARHPIRAADAAQLAAALVVAEPDLVGVPFACLDERLSLAAEREGLSVLR